MQQLLHILSSTSNPELLFQTRRDFSKMQRLVLILCLGWLGSSLAFPVGPVDGTSGSALQREADLGLSTPADESPRSQAQHVLQSKSIDGEAQTPAGASTDSKALQRRSDWSPESELEMIRELAEELRSGDDGLEAAMADCVAVRQTHPNPCDMFS